jgi:hypothetical protein
MSGMVAGQIPVAATATSVTSSTATLAASFMPAHTGDVTSPAGSAVNTLATVNSNVGTFQGLTVNAKGQVTAAANQSYVTGGPYLPTAGGTVTGNVTVNGQLVAAGSPGTYPALDTSGAAVSIATASSYALPAFSGLIIVNNHSNGDVGLYLVGGGISLLISTTAATWVAATTTPAAGKNSVGFGGGAYRIYTNVGSTNIYGIMFLATRPAV